MPVAKRAAAGKLSAESTSFVGRRRLLAEVKAEFAHNRLLTLVGPGGVGKTRLALRAAADLSRSVRDGVWFIDLAGLEDPHLVQKAVISNLGLADRSGQWPTSLLVAHLASREALLVLDNCEHLLDAIAVLADVVLKEAAGVRLLATSRQPLSISGERVLQVPPLTLPGEGSGSAQSEAVALFVARSADAGIQLEDTDATRELVFDLCRHLDGMPLALELAAVRLRTIGLEDLIERLSDRFALLTGGSRTALPRQQTLMAAIDWSHDMLNGQESALLRRLAVFPSEFGLDAAEAVAVGTGLEPMSVLDLLSSLIEKSFVARLGAAASARYRLHETMREYALLKLREANEEAVAVKAFIRFYSTMCGVAEAAAQSVHVITWLKRMDGEADNVRAALRHCLNGPDHAVGMSMAGSLLWYWTARATSEGAYWLGLFLQRREADPSALSRALYARGFMAMTQGDAAAAQPMLVEAEATARAVGDHAAMVGRPQRAARLLGAAESLQTDTGIRLMRHMEPLLALARETISGSLGPAALESETQAGRRMVRDVAIAYALEEKKPSRLAGPPIDASTMPLSKRQLEIAGLLSEGLSNKEIASRTFLSERTVETHVSNILDKLGINSRVEIAAWVAQDLSSGWRSSR